MLPPTPLTGSASGLTVFHILDLSTGVANTFNVSALELL